MVKYCLYLHHGSSGAYDTLRNSGVIALPSGRTFRDYKHFCKSTPGFAVSTDQQLIDLARKTRPTELSKYVAILIDEMYVKEGLVFDKHTGALTGVVDMGDINNAFIDYENRVLKNDHTSDHRPLAKTILVFMVRGLLCDITFPHSIFPSRSPKGHAILPLMWNLIERLTRTGFRVMAVTCDGASCNRSLFQLHASKGEVAHKVRNVFNGDNIYFFSDPPHLMKTVRNCFASPKRNLWVSILYLCQDMQTEINSASRAS